MLTFFDFIVFVENLILWRIESNENKRTALKLYRANIVLSEKLYAIIGMLEVILRNSIDRHFVSIKGNYWLEDAVRPGGYLDVSAGCEDSFHVAQESIQKLGLAYTHEGLISRLTFGFWTYQFAKKQFAAAGSTLLEIFPNRPLGVNQKTVFQDLVKINEIRNRIAHYEPICFQKGTEMVSTTHAASRYMLILELLHWLGCNPRRILYGLDGVSRAIAVVNLI